MHVRVCPHVHACTRMRVLLHVPGQGPFLGLSSLGILLLRDTAALKGTLRPSVFKNDFLG